MLNIFSTLFIQLPYKDCTPKIHKKAKNNFKYNNGIDDVYFVICGTVAASGDTKLISVVVVVVVTLVSVFICGVIGVFVVVEASVVDANKTSGDPKSSLNNGFLTSISPVYNNDKVILFEKHENGDKPAQVLDIHKQYNPLLLFLRLNYQFQFFSFHCSLFNSQNIHLTF